MIQINIAKAILAGGFGVLVGLAHASFAPHVSGEMIVKLKKDSEKAFTQAYKNYGIEIVRDMNVSFGNFKVVRFNQNQKTMKSLVFSLSADPNVEYAEPNFIYSTVRPQEKLAIEELLSTVDDGKVKSSHEEPTDPRFDELWGLRNTGSNAPGGSRGRAGADVNALKAWEITKGSKAIKIAVIDTGIDYNHPDLRENMWVNEAEANGQEGVDDDGNGFVDDVHGYDFANDDGDPMDGHNHGTHCAGVIGAIHSNGVGIAGMMADVTLVAVKFLTDTGSGTLENAVKAIDYSTQAGVDIMSNSWGGGGFSASLKEAIERARDAGVIFTAAAGNSRSDNDQRPHYPSNYEVENVISVAAHTAQDKLASFSCYGKRTVHIAAPGHKILSTVKNDGYQSYSGTSMATPFVSGALGLLLAQEGRMGHTEVRERLMETSIPVSAYRGKTIRSGRLSAYNLLTDTRPPRREPKPGKWKTIQLDELWESEHPYGNNVTVEKVFEVPGAKYIRLKIAKYEFEKRYDYILVAGASRTVAEKVLGKGSNYETEYVEGEKLIATFKSDRSINKWGFKIEEIQWQ